MKKERESGVTMIALIVMVVVLAIILSISITAGIYSSGKTKDEKLLSELTIVQQAVLQQYEKYKVTKQEAMLIGDTLTEEQNATLFVGDYLFSRILEPEKLKQIGISHTQDTYIVNYKTGEVYNATKKTTSSGDPLYIMGGE